MVQTTNIYIFTGWEAGKSKIKVLADSVSGETSPPVLRMSPSGCVLTGPGAGAGGGGGREQALSSFLIRTPVLCIRPHF